MSLGHKTEIFQNNLKNSIHFIKEKKSYSTYSDGNNILKYGSAVVLQKLILLLCRLGNYNIILLSCSRDLIIY